MYNAQTTKNRIKSTCKLQKVSMEEVLAECELGINAIRQINDIKGMASFSLAKISDKLNCYVDYLLGRTELKSVPKTAAEIETIERYLSLSPLRKMEIDEIISKAFVEQKILE